MVLPGLCEEHWDNRSRNDSCPFSLTRRDKWTLGEGETVSPHKTPPLNQHRAALLHLHTLSVKLLQLLHLNTFAPLLHTPLDSTDARGTDRVVTIAKTKLEQTATGERMTRGGAVMEAATNATSGKFGRVAHKYLAFRLADDEYGLEQVTVGRFQLSRSGVVGGSVVSTIHGTLGAPAPAYHRARFGEFGQQDPSRRATCGQLN